MFFLPQLGFVYLFPTIVVSRIETRPGISIMTSLLPSAYIPKDLSWYSETTFTLNTVRDDDLIDLSMSRDTEKIRAYLTTF